MPFVDFLGRHLVFDCLGCAIGSGQATPPGGMIAQTEHFVLHQDPEVPVKAFLIVAAKRHIQSIQQMGTAEAAEFFRLVYHARQAIESVSPGCQVTLIQEERSRHLHLWLWPRYDWMEAIQPNSLSAVRDLMAHAKTHWKTEDHLREVINTVIALRRILSTQYPPEDRPNHLPA